MTLHKVRKLNWFKSYGHAVHEVNVRAVRMDDFDMEHAADSNDCVMAELPYSIEESPLLGRHLVAQRNLDRGELILCEKPIGKI